MLAYLPDSQRVRRTRDFAWNVSSDSSKSARVPLGYFFILPSMSFNSFSAVKTPSRPTTSAYLITKSRSLGESDGPNLSVIFGPSSRIPSPQVKTVGMPRDSRFQRRRKTAEASLPYSGWVAVKPSFLPTSAQMAPGEADDSSGSLMSSSARVAKESRESKAMYFGRVSLSARSKVHMALSASW